MPISNVPSSPYGLLRDFSGEIGSINLLDMRRVLSMMEPYPRDHLEQDGLIDERVFIGNGAPKRVMPWMGTGAIYGHPDVVRVVKTLTRKKLSRLLKG